ncbi:MAG: 4Fe-4S ferredoxin, partial [Desulfarculaceae bacterium]|nr:4Fe-4S ferredoxin [Desulfarculaceae bacterium]MCF8048986.1 4Fe-4S ferredoxin [Desulfarculaceae bacterium]
VCPEQVQSIGLRPQMLAQAEALAREKATADGASPESWRDYVYGLDENGGTNTVYVSPVPFAVVSAAIDQAHAELAPGQGKGRNAAGKQGGKRRKKGYAGRPPMHPVANSMESAENLTTALVLAPLAGLAAGFTKLFGKKPPQDQPPSEQGGQS